MPIRKTHEAYERDLNRKYGKKVVVLDSYDGQHCKLRHLLLPEKHEFSITPKHILSSKVKDLESLRKNVLTPAAKRLSRIEYVSLLNARFKGKIECLHKGDIRMRTFVLHRYKHHDFMARPYRMLHDKVDGDYIRNRVRLYTIGNRDCSTEQFQKALLERNIHTSCSYFNGNVKVNVRCLVCDTHWTPKAQRVYRGLSNCPKCNRINRFSKSAINWLEDLSSKFELHIQHADNGGEHSILISNNRRVRVDGFCAALNICFEYYGDVYHGNPKRFPSDAHCHPFRRNKTAGELYSHTIQREQDLKRLGYTVISIWERDFKRSKDYENG